ncbi:hypothetical protein D9M68_398840 [compost metagenome]
MGLSVPFLPVFAAPDSGRIICAERYSCASTVTSRGGHMASFMGAADQRIIGVGGRCAPAPTCLLQRSETGVALLLEGLDFLVVVGAVISLGDFAQVDVLRDVA